MFIGKFFESENLIHGYAGGSHDPLSPKVPNSDRGSNRHLGHRHACSSSTRVYRMAHDTFHCGESASLPLHRSVGYGRESPVVLLNGRLAGNWG